MNPTIKDIQKLMNNKTICLIGNSRSILKNEKDIDIYDVICRCNRGKPQGKSKYIGSRTDILFLSTKIDGVRLQRNFNPRFIIWLPPGRKRVTPFVKNNAYFVPKEEWQILYDKLSGEYRPSTGLMALNFILNHLEFKKLIIYGFDFFKSGTWYHQIKSGVHEAHNPEEEKKIIIEMIKNRPNVEMRIE